ncbi:hypothetical protein C0991_004226 [Blastosporella zonata]|nr:hypothetical protein C0991_004226 [Blastosporella zonata]
MRLLIFATALAGPAHAARLLHSLPEDAHAFPKFRVAFLNRLPLLADTAQRWLTNGLRGGELEFLDQPWTDRLESGQPVPQPSVNYTLEQLKMGPTDSYLCLIPKPGDNVQHPTNEEDSSDFELAPSRSWSLLQPLSGTCLYHRQGWFTYSYCHNQEIRQFKEAESSAGGHRPPQEDPDWESYTLGKAPQPVADLTTADQNAQANLELARNAGSQYLVQRWSDGTLCDKTHKPREVEIQFHCSMTMTDTILFVKEAKTCSYVVVINTPRLCGEPGFKSHRDTSGEHQIRCREIVDQSSQNSATDVPANVPDLDYPIKLPRRKPVLPPAPAKEGPKVKVGGVEVGDKAYNEILLKTLEALTGGKDGKVALQEVAADPDGVIFELVEEIDMSEEQVVAMEKLEETLRAAGYDIQGKASTATGKKGDKAAEKKGQAQTNKNKKPARRWPWREEL